MLDGQMLIPVVGDRLVEGGVLLLGDIVGLAHPDLLLLVEELPLFFDLLDLLLLLGLRLILVFLVSDLINDTFYYVVTTLRFEHD